MAGEDSGWSKLLAATLALVVKIVLPGSRSRPAAPDGGPGGFPELQVPEHRAGRPWGSLERDKESM